MAFASRLFRRNSTRIKKQNDNASSQQRKTIFLFFEKPIYNFLEEQTYSINHSSFMIDILPDTHLKGLDYMQRAHESWEHHHQPSQTNEIHQTGQNMYHNLNNQLRDPAFNRAWQQENKGQYNYNYNQNSSPYQINYTPTIYQVPNANMQIVIQQETQNNQQPNQ